MWTNLEWQERSRTLIGSSLRPIPTTIEILNCDIAILELVIFSYWTCRNKWWEFEPEHTSVLPLHLSTQRHFWLPVWQSRHTNKESVIMCVGRRGKNGWREWCARARIPITSRDKYRNRMSRDRYCPKREAWTRRVIASILWNVVGWSSTYKTWVSAMSVAWISRNL